MQIPPGDDDEIRSEVGERIVPQAGVLVVAVPTVDITNVEGMLLAGTTRSEWLVPAGLVVLSVVPVVAGAARLVELSIGTVITPDNARFVASPVPVIVHIVSATTFTLVGAFQFAPGFRRRRRGWHRAAGRVLVPMGLAAALSGLWMTAVYPLPPSDGALLGAFRWGFGSAMVAALLLGVAALRRRDHRQHGAWMMRAYAIGLGAGTQVLTIAPWALLVGEPGPLAKAVLMAAGWVINLAVAERTIRRRRTRPRRVRSVRALASAAAGPRT